MPLAMPVARPGESLGPKSRCSPRCSVTGTGANPGAAPGEQRICCRGWLDVDWEFSANSLLRFVFGFPCSGYLILRDFKRSYRGCSYLTRTREKLVTILDLIESQVEGLSDNFRCYRYQSKGIRISLVWKCCTSCLGNCMLNDKVRCLNSVLFVWGHTGWRTARPTWACRWVSRKSTNSGQAFSYWWRYGTCMQVCQ